jgi:hypothetical protein
MPKQIIPHKILISFKEDGTFKDGILIYQILDDKGKLSTQYNTIQINSEISVPIINGIIQKSKLFTEKAENITAEIVEGD